nr:hypothetical protein [Lachnospiraceae bacterium]
NKNGKVKVDKTVAPGTDPVTVRATAADGSGVYGEASFTIVEAADRVLVTANEAALAEPVYDINMKKDSISTLRLYTANVDDGESIDEHMIELNASVLSKTGVETGTATEWSVSDPRVVRVTQEGGSVTLKAVGKGTANVTCTAMDGSKKKAKFKVKVVVPISSVSIVSVNNTGEDQYLAYGCSRQFKAIPGSTYGEPGKMDFDWDCDFLVEIYGTDQEGNSVDQYVLLPANEEIKAAKLIKIKNGKLTVARRGKLAQYVDREVISKEYPEINITGLAYYVRVRATAKDRSGKSGEYMQNLTDLTKKVNVYASESDEKPIKKVVMDVESERSFYVYADYEKYDTTSKEYYIQEHQFPHFYITVVSSNPRVAGGVVDLEIKEIDGELVYYAVLYVITHEKGSAKLTLIANDGTNKKTTLNVKVEPGDGS